VDLVSVEQANCADHVELTRIAFAAKQHWRYPEEYYQVWAKELTITTEYIRQNQVFTAKEGSRILGFYSLVFDSDMWFLDHIFIDPAHLKCGIGRKLMAHAKEIAKQKGAQEMTIYVDPYAAGFYEKIGARKIGMLESSIKGRSIPIYRITL
jgi:GNAT superfamily N-acetyltransferase